MAEGWLNKPVSFAGKRVFVAGHSGMVGRAVTKRLGIENCVVLSAQRAQLDFRDQSATLEWVQANKPDIIILAAAKVGGIMDNANHPADFLYDNLMIESNVIHAAHKYGLEKLLFLGSSCIYPKEAENPIKEDALLSGPLEATNEPYALAKIAGVKLCQAYRVQHGCDFISAMPCNLYGAGDTFDLHRSHVIPALMLKAHEAKISGEKTINVWGTGKPYREFLHVEDLADALIFMLKNYSGLSPVNIGSGVDVSISELAQIICDVVGFEGVVEFDETKPDGTMCKLMDSGRINTAGWKPKINLRNGLQKTYDWFVHTRETLHAA